VCACALRRRTGVLRSHNCCKQQQQHGSEQQQLQLQQTLQRQQHGSEQQQLQRQPRSAGNEQQGG
jgi:hypothetical protein